MNEFSPSDAALEGFRLTREHPGVVLAWGAVYFVGVLAIAMVMLIGLGPQFATFMRDGNLDPAEREAFGDLLLKSWPAFLVVMATMLMVFAVLTAGVFRLVLRPHETGFARLRLGADEVRLAVVNLALFGIGLGLFVVGELVLSAMFGAGGAAEPAFLVVAAAFAFAMIWVGVRLCLATPLTFVEKRISLPAAWRLTRGRFWSLFGMIVLAGIFYLMIFLLISIINLVFVRLAGGQESLTDVGALTPVTAIAMIISIMIQLLLPILQLVTLYAPFAVAYRALKGPPQAALDVSDRGVARPPAP